jgi:hypothetical protein
MMLYAAVRLDIAYVEGNALRPAEAQLLQLLYQVCPPRRMPASALS